MPRRYGGKRRPLEVRCQSCGKEFWWYSNGQAFTGSPKKWEPKTDEPVTFVGRERKRFEYRTFRLTEWRHGCGGKLKRLSLPDPMKKVIRTERGMEVLECGHKMYPRKDFYGDTIATKRQCADCGKARRIEAMRNGTGSFNPEDLK